jgi:lipid-A-disaccharide synthase-like uncharacterized protein
LQFFGCVDDSLNIKSSHLSMNDLIRAYLYPLGFIPSLFFAARFFIQWFNSEKKQECHITPIFWRLSLAGNIFLIIHSLIQVQFHIAIVQSCSAIISWRNLNLMQPIDRQAKFSTVTLLIIFSLFATTSAFVLQSFIFFEHFDWIRTPTLPWSNSPTEKLPLYWHLIGTIGIFLFALRFWVQWWLAEKHQKSYLGRSFWWLSIIGASCALSYFIRLNDIIHIIGHGLGIVPYIRNLQLIKKNHQT